MRVLRYSLFSIATASVIGLIFAALSGRDMMKSVFDFNYILAVIVLLYGLGVYFMPIRVFKKNRLVDHSNYMDYIREEKERKLEGSMESIIWGISNILLVGAIEILIQYVIG